MPRTLSMRALAALYAQETGEAVITLLTITHPSMAAPIRVCSEVLPGSVPLVSNGNQFLSWPFDVQLPLDAQNEMPTVKLAIDNVLGEIVPAIRSLPSPPDILMQLVLAATPNNVEAEWTLQLMQVDYNASTVNGTLSYQDVLSEPYPKDSVTPDKFPGIFR
jgi:hypothetical protein